MTQTTLDADAFGDELCERIDRARGLQDEAEALIHALNENRIGEWRPAVINDAYGWAANAIHHAGDEDKYELYLRIAETKLDEAKWAFPDAADNIDAYASGGERE